jgi:hypothetical protein
MVNLKSFLSTLFAVTVLVGSTLSGMQMPTVNAATVSAPAVIRVQDDPYYEYWDAHRSELEASGYCQGDVVTALIKWSEVSGADGYKVKVYWDDSDGGYTDIVNVKKSGGKYIMSNKGCGKYIIGHTDVICKTARALVTGPCKTRIKTSSLKFGIWTGTSFALKKVTIKSFKLVNGKKVWSPANTYKLTW